MFFDSPALKDITPEANIVSWPQLETDEPVTVYLFLPVAQFETLAKTPTDAFGSVVVVVVLNRGVSTIAHPVEPPPPPPLPPLPLCPNNDIDMRARQTTTNAVLIKQFFILPPPPEK